MVKLSVQGLDFWYNGKQVLHGVSLEIMPRRITALIGPSGCGKSTLLRCMNRMNDLIPIAHMSGRVLYEGRDIYAKDTDVPALRRRVGMVFQKPNPFPMSVFDNVAYGLRLQGTPNPDHLGKRVQESLEKADLWDEVKDRLQLSAFRLSGGQQQRLCIARALAVEPDVLLLDEPCSSLDPIATARIEELLARLKRTHTLVIVTHNMQQAKRVSDETCYLLDGRVVEFGPTARLFTHPTERLTREYIRGDFG